MTVFQESILQTCQKIQFTTIPWTGELPFATTSTEKSAGPRLNGHRAAWLDSIHQGLRHPVYIIKATEGDCVVGVLPLCLVAGPIFGRFLVSLPYINTGGVWAHNQTVARGLIDAGCELADQLDVKYLELRHEVEVPHDRLNFKRTDKVHMRLPLPDTYEGLMASLKSKVRSQVKKSYKSDLSVQFGGGELLKDFYHVFSTNMRDLGTPVFSRKLFASILNSFEGDAELCVVSKDSNPAAAGLLVHVDGVTEVPSASCLRAFNVLNANMFMYSKLLERAIDRGSQTFDFGRSSEDSGTFKFKKQWGAKPHPAVWQYFVRKGDPADMRPDSGGKQRLVRIWQRLPVWITKLAGPSIVRGIP